AFSLERQAAALLHRRDEEHVGALAIELEILARPLGEDAGREGAERLAILDLEVEVLLHLLVAGVTEDGARAQPARAELEASGQVPDDLAAFEELGDGRGASIGIEPPVRVSMCLEEGLDLRIGVARAEVAAALARSPAGRERARLLEVRVISVERRAQRA